MSLSVADGFRPEIRETNSDWPTVELGDVCYVQLGKMLSPKSKAGTRPVPYLRNENVQWNRFDLSDVAWMDFSEAEEEKFRLRPGDLLVCEGGEPGRAAVWEGQIERCCYQKALHRIRPRDERLFPPFLMYRLWMSAMNGEFAGSQTQTTISHVPREKLVRLAMSLPPPTKQRRIAAWLNRALADVGAVRRIAEDRLAAAEALPAAYLREVFEGPEATKWGLIAIGDLARTCSGSTPPRGRLEYFGGGIPWVKTGELVDGLIGADATTEETVTDLALRDCSLPRLPIGTLLIAMYGQGQTRGRTGLLAREATTNQACFAILPNPDAFSSEFLQLWFRANYGRLRALTENRGGNQPNLNGVLLRGLKVALPPPAEQRLIAKYLASRLASADDLIRACREELTGIESLPPTILRTAFSEDR